MSRGSRRHWSAVAGLVLTIAASGCRGGGDQPPPPSPTGEAIEIDGGVATPYGRGAERVWVLTPTSGDVESVVVYLHGWGARLPFEWHLVWLEHLLARGSAVLFPEYQDGVDDALSSPRTTCTWGCASGSAHFASEALPWSSRGSPSARRSRSSMRRTRTSWDSRRRRQSTRSSRSTRSRSIRRSTCRACATREVLILAGDRDATVGRVGAEALAAQLDTLPTSLLRYRLLRSTDDLVADHEAPTYIDDPVVRATFWTPLDELVEDAR